MMMTIMLITRAREGKRKRTRKRKRKRNQEVRSYYSY
jgi:hypothetical protein